MIEMYIGLSEGGWAIGGRSQAWERHDDPHQAVCRWSTEIESRHATRWRKASIDLWLSGGLARPFLCGPVDGLAGWTEAEGFAAAMAGDATGQDGPQHVVLESWPGTRPALAIAMAGSMSQAIETLRHEHRIVWRSVRPKWASALNDALASHASMRLFAFSETDAVTVISGALPNAKKGGSAEFEHASTYVPVQDADEMAALRHRILLARDVAEADTWFSEMSALAIPTDVQTPDAATRPSPRAARSFWGSLRRGAVAWPSVERLVGDAAS